MDWITEHVAIGTALEAHDPDILAQHAFRSVVSLDGSLLPRHAADYGLAEICSYKLIDGPGNDLRVIEFAILDLERLCQSSPPVLVHCQAGRSRSPTIVAGYLMRAGQLTAGEAIAQVAAKREINITAALVDLLHKVAR